MSACCRGRDCVFDPVRHINSLAQATLSNGCLLSSARATYWHGLCRRTKTVCRRWHTRGKERALLECLYPSVEGGTSARQAAEDGTEAPHLRTPVTACVFPLLQGRSRGATFSLAAAVTTSCNLLSAELLNRGGVSK